MNADKCHQVTQGAIVSYKRLGAVLEVWKNETSGKYCTAQY